MPKRDKIIIAGSLSLGILWVTIHFFLTKLVGIAMLTYNHSAGACGIKRTTELPNLIKQEYLSA